MDISKDKTSKRPKTYHVYIEEVWVRTIEVEAPNEQSAIKKAWTLCQTGKEKEILFEFSHFVDDEDDEYCAVKEINNE